MSSPYRFRDMVFLSFLTSLNKKQLCPKVKVTNIIIENKSGPLYMVTNRHFFVLRPFLKTIEKTADTSWLWTWIWYFIKIKHMGHVFHSILDLEFEFEGKIYNFMKMWISRNFKIKTLIENKGQHFSEIVILSFILGWKHATYVWFWSNYQTKQSQLMSAVFWWF